jgi:serine/threonine-protein phosphatase 4 regulatory subunit 2
MDLPETRDLYLNALQAFNPHQQIRKPELDDYLTTVAKTGCTLFEWSTIRRYFLYKLENVMKEVNESEPYDESSSMPNTEHCDSKTYIERIMNAAESFDGIPFTIQRLAELLTNPRKHYKRADKYFRALEKNVVIVTTVSPDGDRETNRNSTSISTTPALMNGKSDDTVVLSNDEMNGNGSFSSAGGDVLMEDASREPSSNECEEFNEFGVPTPRPMPSIETLWESAHTADHRSSPTSVVAASVPLSLLDDEPSVGTAADTSLDSLSPSISQAMAGGADDLLSKETYSSSSMGNSGPQNQLATMTPLQVSQLSSSSNSPVSADETAEPEPNFMVETNFIME